MTTIAIFGVGLIGGSLALCFKGKPDIRVIGHSSRPESVDKYIKRGVVDEATISMQEAAEAADIIFVCVPVGMLDSYLEQLQQYKLKPGCIITDVGSTKASIVAAAGSLTRSDVYFIGGHPMAGSERSGVEAASSHLFENAYYVLTPHAGTPQEAVSKLEELLQYTKAHIVKMDARQHDDIVGAISHLPHMIAVALVNQIRRYNDGNTMYQQLAAGGFRDITRIASSDPTIWRDILINNRDVLLKLLSDWNGEIERFIAMLQSSDAAGIERQFAEAGRFRKELPERRKGMITSLHDLYVDVPDHPGVIGHIASLLGGKRINLSNIQVIESREDVPGILRLSFRHERDMDRAAELLRVENYTVHV